VGRTIFQKEGVMTGKAEMKAEPKKVKAKVKAKAKIKKRENKSKDKMIMMTDSKTKEVKRLQHNVTAKADEVKAIKRSKNELRMKPEKQLDKIRKNLALTETKLQFLFHLHLAATFYISILIFNYLLSDHFDHPF
jgi:hypothetical protein